MLSDAVATRCNYSRPRDPRSERPVPALELESIRAPLAAIGAGGLGILVTGLFLGIRHGFDWDHIAAITDITSTTASGRMAEAAHTDQHHDLHGHSHAHGGALEVQAHHAGPGAATLAPALPAAATRRTEGLLA